MAVVVNFAEYRERIDKEAMDLVAPKDIVGRIKKAINGKMTFSTMIENIIADVAKRKYNRGRNTATITRMKVFPEPDYYISLADIDEIVQDNATRTRDRRITEIRCWEGNISDALKEYCKAHNIVVTEQEKVV